MNKQLPTKYEQMSATECELISVAYASAFVTDEELEIPDPELVEDKDE
jgi:hypothetical protein